MDHSHAASPLVPGVERLLSSLTGVFSAHVVVGPKGALREIHVLATPELHPKRVVRNIESALSAGLGIEIDRRIVSVAQVRPDADSASVVAPAAGKAVHGPVDTAETGTASPGVDAIAAEPTAPAPSELPRVVFLGYETHIDASRRAMCHVTLRSGPDEFTGKGQGPDTLRGRAEAAAQATFAALAACRGQDRLGLEGVAIVEMDGKSYVLVAARALVRHRPVPLTGTALMDRSPEEAAILASLQATNRWRVSL